MRFSSKSAALAAAVAAVALPTVSTLAATDTWTGAAPTSAYYSLTNSTLTFAYWDDLVTNTTDTPNTADGMNFTYDGTVAGQNHYNDTSDNTTGGSGTAMGDDVVFTDATTGTTNIAPQSTSQTPDSIVFQHATGGTAQTFVFLRASTTAGNSTSTNSTNTGSAPADGFNAVTPFGASGTSVVVLQSGFQGTVIFRARSTSSSEASSAYTVNGANQSAVIQSGTLELDDAGALPGSNGSNSNSPNIELSGGQLTINIDTGGNVAPSSTQMAGILTVNANSQLTNGQSTTQGNFYNGSVNITSGSTLTVNPGLGVSAKMTLTGQTSTSPGGTLSLGSNNGFLRNSSTGSTGLTFALGTGGGAYQPGTDTTVSLGALTGNSTTALYGSTTNDAFVASSPTDTYSVGALGAVVPNDVFNGQIVNGAAVSSVSGGVTAAVDSLRPVALIKVGTGTLTLNNANIYAGGTTVSAGTLAAGSSHAFSDSAAAITLNAGTLDYNGYSPAAGQAYVLGGGSLVNNGSSPVTLASGASGSVSTAAGTTSTAAVGANLIVGSGTTPAVTVSAPTTSGGVTASASAQMQLAAVLVSSGGSGYTSTPTVTVSAPTTPGGRTAVVVPTLSSGSITGYTVIDPGSGYTSVPTVTISGGGGSGATANVDGVISGLLFSNAGSGYTSAPTISVTNVGTGGTAPTITSNYGQISITASSSVGGGGALTVNSAITGTATGITLTKIGAGTTTFNASNTYAANTTVAAGTLDGAVAASLGTGNVSVAPGTGSTATLELDNLDALLNSQTLSFTDATGALDSANAYLNYSGTDTIASLADDGLSLPSGTYCAPTNTVAILQGDTPETYLTGNGTLTVVAAPEPASVALLMTTLAGLLAGRRRR